MGEVHEILRYKRPYDSWLCPECDTENSVSLGKCMVCGCKKTSSATILKQWTEADDRPVTPPPKKATTSTTTTSVLEDTEKDSYVPEEETNNNKIILGVIIAIIIIFFLLIAISQGSTYAAYSDAMNKYNDGNYETALMMFDYLPSNYKNVSYMIDESKYQTAYSLFNSGNYNEANRWINL